MPATLHVKVVHTSEVPMGEGMFKVADEGWLPFPLPHGRTNDRPSVALEVDEMECKLRDDAKMWVNPGQSGVNIALAIKAQNDIPLLKIEKWGWTKARVMAAVTRQVEVRGRSLCVWRAFDYPISRNMATTFTFPARESHCPWQNLTPRPGKNSLELS
ncbi:hypothetical protein N7540_006746 [Penicillium herquei]|nr:hypothetical protein N7540_006746 [Penicillium herquei]